jgi:hypothetical protein
MWLHAGRGAHSRTWAICNSDEAKIPAKYEALIKMGFSREVLDMLLLIFEKNEV